MTLEIRQTTMSDLNEIVRVQEESFGYVKEADLTRDLLHDPTAEPRLSLLAFERGEATGHILFTAAKIPKTEFVCSILAPLAVVPKSQKQGVGGSLIEAGLKMLRKSGVNIVFVLGHPKYYPKFGFTPIHPLPINAPYPIPDEYSDAWMIQVLDDTQLSSVSGTVVVSEKLSKPQHWRE